MLPSKELNGENNEGKQENYESNEQEILFCFDLVIEILSRLPVKSLLRFRSVSKTWLALISNPKFIKSHMILATNKKDYTNHRLILRTTRPENNLKDCSLKSLLYESVIEESDMDYPMKNSSRYSLARGSVNGLICLVNLPNNIFLWNPTTRKYRKLPDFKTNVSDVGHFLYGFGYDEIQDDYKVVRIFTNISPQRYFQEASMYSLKNDSWKRIDYSQNKMRLIGSGKFVNGKLHWATTADLGYEKGWSITSFDLSDEKWRKLERPYYGERDGILMLGALESYLSMLCNNATGDQVDVWAMKEYGDKGSWIKMFTINYTPDPRDYFLSQSFCLSKGGEFLVMFDSTFVICNPEDNSIKILKFPKFGKVLTVEIYIESLVCPLSQIEPRIQQE